MPSTSKRLQKSFRRFNNKVCKCGHSMRRHSSVLDWGCLDCECKKFKIKEVSK